MTPGTPRQDKTHCDSASQTAIGKMLRASYERVVAEQLPPEISALLDRIKDSEGGHEPR